MTTRVLIAGLVLGMGFSPLAMAADSNALRDYDRASLDSLFEQAQSSEGIVGIADDDDLLVTGSVGSGHSNKNAKKPLEDELPSPYPGAPSTSETYALPQPTPEPPAPLPTSRPRR